MLMLICMLFKIPTRYFCYQLPHTTTHYQFFVMTTLFHFQHLCLCLYPPNALVSLKRMAIQMVHFDVNDIRTMTKNAESLTY